MEWWNNIWLTCFRYQFIAKFISYTLDPFLIDLDEPCYSNSCLIDLRDPYGYFIDLYDSCKLFPYLIDLCDP